jgi:hypothetical protein
MWILLIVAFLIPLVYIGHLMSKVDKFLGEGGLMVENNEIPPVAIVLGEGALAQQVIKRLQKNGIPVLVLTEPFLVQQKQNFRYLFALSESDADNIVLCKIGKKVYNLEKTISLCNDKRNEGMFISEKIRYLSGANATATLLYEIVLQETEVEV